MARCVSMVWALLTVLLVATINRLEARSSPKPPPKPRTKYVVVIFGDSLSDTGNTLRAAGVPDPTIYTGMGVTGRFTNGPNWVDYLNATFSKKHSLQIFNYAYGAATVCASPLMEAFAPFVKNMTSQIADFVADIKSGKVAVDSNTRLLVVDYSGTPDYLIPFEEFLGNGQLPGLADVAALAQATSACRVAGLRTLAGLTGLVTDIAVLPMAPLRMSPRVPAGLVATVAAMEKLIGQITLKALDELQAELNASAPGAPGHGVRLHPLSRDATWIYNGIQKVKPPFKHTDVSCFVNPISSLVITPPGGIQICADPNEYLFFDTQHPTTRFHEWFGVRGVLPRLQTLKLLPY